MPEIADIKGVGPAREERLEDAGYTELETIAREDAAVLAEAADVPEDRALEFIVQAQNMLEEDEGSGETADEESGDELPEPADLAEIEETDEGDEDATEEDDGEVLYEVTVDLDEAIHYDAYMTALYNAYERRHSSHQPTLDAINRLIEDARYNDGTVEHELTEFELNSLHSAVSQQVNDFKGKNMIEHMDAMRDVLGQVNDVRDRELFA